MSDNIERWMKIAEWRGKTYQALEDINDELKEIKQDIKDVKKQNIKRDIRTAEIAGGIAVIIVVLGWIAPIII